MTDAEIAELCTRAATCVACGAPLRGGDVFTGALFAPVHVDCNNPTLRPPPRPVPPSFIAPTQAALPFDEPQP
jgi:hypothetical protein